MLSCFPMTKVETAFDLSRKLGEEDLVNFAKLTSVYGILMTKLSPSLDNIRVEYDASRLTPDQLQVVLGSHGMPIKVPVV
ncbi:MAG TPA: hypothetical protein VN633_17865 [Bryobacteraceae bacterium]|nr:hypothetical protein [Bryobacteraceae bacterium]